MSRVQPVFTNLGMHFVSAGAEVMLVQVEVNVRGLLSLHARRLIKSKRAMASVSSGTVRMTLATPDSQEKAVAVREVVAKCDDYDRMAELNCGLYAEVGRLRSLVRQPVFQAEHEGSGI